MSCCVVSCGRIDVVLFVVCSRRRVNSSSSCGRVVTTLSTSAEMGGHWLYKFSPAILKARNQNMHDGNGKDMIAV